MPKYICTRCGFVFTDPSRRKDYETPCPFCHSKSFVSSYGKHQAYLKEANRLYYSSGNPEYKHGDIVITPKGKAKIIGIGKMAPELVTVFSDEFGERTFHISKIKHNENPMEHLSSGSNPQRRTRGMVRVGAYTRKRPGRRRG